jgi:hypothetical protein
MEHPQRKGTLRPRHLVGIQLHRVDRPAAELIILCVRTENRTVQHARMGALGMRFHFRVHSPVNSGESPARSGVSEEWNENTKLLQSETEHTSRGRAGFDSKKLFMNVIFMNCHPERCEATAEPVEVEAPSGRLSPLPKSRAKSSGAWTPRLPATAKNLSIFSPRTRPLSRKVGPGGNRSKLCVGCFARGVPLYPLRLSAFLTTQGCRPNTLLA